MPLHLGVADIEGYSSEGVVLGYPDLIDTLQPLCNGPIAGAYFPPEQLRAVVRRIRLAARSKLHECVPRSSHTETREVKQKARVGVVDSLIILCVSAALVIFLFWIASQTLRLDTFLTIPSFIQDSFKAIWTSVAAGATGIGLAVYKALTRSSNEPTPNHLLLIGITTGTMIVLIFLLIFVLTSIGPGSTSRNSNLSTNARPASVRKVVLMDSASKDDVYNFDSQKNGKTNADDISAYVLLKISGIETQSVLVTKEWQRQNEVLASDPDLVITHLGSFSGSPEEQLSQLDVFLNLMAEKNKKKTIFLIYTRKRDLLDQAARSGWISQRENVNTSLKGRICLFLLGAEPNPDFRQSAIATKFEILITTILETGQCNNSSQ